MGRSRLCDRHRHHDLKMRGLIKQQQQQKSIPFLGASVSLTQIKNEEKRRRRHRRHERRQRDRRIQAEKILVLADRIVRRHDMYEATTQRRANGATFDASALMHPCNSIGRPQLIVPIWPQHHCVQQQSVKMMPQPCTEMCEMDKNMRDSSVRTPVSHTQSGFVHSIRFGNSDHSDVHMQRQHAVYLPDNKVMPVHPVGHRKTATPVGTVSGNVAIHTPEVIMTPVLRKTPPPPPPPPRMARVGAQASPDDNALLLGRIPHIPIAPPSTAVQGYIRSTRDDATHSQLQQQPIPPIFKFTAAAVPVTQRRQIRPAHRQPSALGPISGNSILTTRPMVPPPPAVFVAATVPLPSELPTASTADTDNHDGQSAGSSSGVAHADVQTYHNNDAHSSSFSPASQVTTPALDAHVHVVRSDGSDSTQSQPQNPTSVLPSQTLLLSTTTNTAPPSASPSTKRWLSHLVDRLTRKPRSPVLPPSSSGRHGGLGMDTLPPDVPQTDPHVGEDMNLAALKQRLKELIAQQKTLSKIIRNPTRRSGQQLLGLQTKERELQRDIAYSRAVLRRALFSQPRLVVEPTWYPAESVDVLANDAPMSKRRATERPFNKLHLLYIYRNSLKNSQRELVAIQTQIEDGVSSEENSLQVRADAVQNEIDLQLYIISELEKETSDEVPADWITHKSTEHANQPSTRQWLQEFSGYDSS